MSTFWPCAYYTIWPHPQVKHPGIAVVDVADPHYPRASTRLKSPAALDSNEGLTIDPARKLLMISRFSFGPSGEGLYDFYDLFGDAISCRRGVYLASHPTASDAFSTLGTRHILGPSRR